MFQIDDSTAVAVEPTPAAPGTPGYFTDGNPSLGIPATIVTADWFNQVTDELLNVLAAAGISPVKATHNQVVSAINFLITSKIGSAFATAFQAYAGNPNGHVAGSAGSAGSTFPSVVFDITNNIWWVCTTTGTTSTAGWTEIGESGVWPFYGGTSTGTANAQVITVPSSVQSFGAGDQFFFTAGFSNTGAMTVTVPGTGGGTFPVRKDGPSGPIALAGGEVVAGNTPTMKFDGTYLHLSATEMGTAALANASSNTGTVAAVSGSGGITPGHLAVFGDAAGTVADGGPYNVPSGSYINGNATVAPGVYIVDTSVASITLTLTAGEPAGASWEFIDGSGTWSPNNLTINLGSYTFTPPYASQAQGGPIVANVAGEAFTLWFNGTTLKVV
jgi:hypothetical protein